MNEIENSKRKQINDIVSAVKLSSLLFSGIVFFRYYQINFNIGIRSFNYVVYFNFIVSGILILSLIYFIWAFSTIKRFKDSKYINTIQIIENFVFVLIFSSIILISGANASGYKYLFLFIIITSTIQSGMRQGMTIAVVSSFIILTIDILFLPNVRVNQYFENDLILTSLFMLTAWPLGFYVKIENEHILNLQTMANEDGLTGVYNHRYFHDALKEKIALCGQENQPVSMIFIDIDYFKYYNDLYGHLKGDEVLKKIVMILKNGIQEEGVVARYGGEEFAVILPRIIESDAIKIAERIRSKIEKTYFDGEENQPNGKLTVSIGISIYPYKAKNNLELINSADDALYRAKFFNKNRVETYTSILDDLKNDIEEEHIDLITSIKTLISVINAKDRYTYAHVERVVVFSRLLADKLGLNEEDKKNLIYGAYMHDIGKINISKEILNKKMPLTNQEWNILKQHPLAGTEIIKPVESLKNIGPLILHHHERYDGNGYPENLKGENIPYLARVLTIVDSFDAMTSKRSYTNKKKTYEEAIVELRLCEGTQFDPTITEVFIDVINENKNKFDNSHF
jgi:diguanylate cyclase (GGDEF)-like protein